MKLPPSGMARNTTDVDPWRCREEQNARRRREGGCVDSGSLKEPTHVNNRGVLPGLKKSKRKSKTIQKNMKDKTGVDHERWLFACPEMTNEGGWNGYL